MTYFGFMHGEAIGIGGGWGVTPGVALAYALVAAGLYAAEKFGTAPVSVPRSEPSLAVPAE
jgi:AGZA family xanthine/uracil permease-like MFS transporter